MTPEEREKKIKELERQLAKETDTKKKDILRLRLWTYKNYERKRLQDKEKKRKKRELKAEQKAKSISILKSRTALELAYIKYTKEDNKKFFSTKNYYS